MFKPPLLERNWDGKQLAADHSQARALGGGKADRLLHGNCNSQRQDGRHDSSRPAIKGVHPSDWAAAPIATTDTMAMDW